MNFQNIKEKIRGPVFPVVTPFKKNYDIDFECLNHYIDFLYDGGARIFHIMVHTSRFGLLLPEEMRALNSKVSNYVKMNYADSIVIAAGPIYGPTSLDIDFAMCAQDSGADIIGLCFSERFYNAGQVFDYFENVAGSCDIGILIHEEQMSTIHGANLMLYPLSLLEDIASIDNVVAIKEDSKEDEYTSKLVKRLKDKLAIIVSGGSKEQFMQFGPLGCQAYLVGVGSFYPQLAVRFFEDYLECNSTSCNEIIDKFERPFFKISKKLGWHIGLKAAMESLGLMDATERPPLCSLDPEGYNMVAAVTKKIMHIDHSINVNLIPSCGVAA